MKKSLFLLVIISIVNLACGNIVKPSSSSKDVNKNHHFKSIFDGKTLNNWKVYGHQKDIEKTYWKVENGTITCNTLNDADHGAIWLFYEYELDDFELKLKFQTPRNSTGNSGVQIRSQYTLETHDIDGPQIDIHPSASYRTGLLYDETDGYDRWIYPSKSNWEITKEEANNKSRYYYEDEENGWNELYISCVGTKIKTILNGVVVCDFDGEGILNDKIHIEQNVGMMGKIALQVHNKHKLLIRFKDIQLKEL